MSLLHGAKKHFILVMVFVAAFSAAICTTVNRALAEKDNLDLMHSQRTAYAKVLINTMAYCVSGKYTNLGDNEIVDITEDARLVVFTA